MADWTQRIEQLRNIGRDTIRSWDLVRSLTDEAGSRFAGSPGEAAALEWGVRVMKDHGLLNVRKERTAATLWQRGPETGEIVSGLRHRVQLSALGLSVPTRDGGIEAEVIEVPSLEALDRMPRSEVEGKIVYLHHVMPRLRDGTGYNAGSSARAAGPSKAARLGAIGYLVRSIGTSTMRVPHTGALFYEPNVPQIPAASLSIPDAEWLHRACSGKQRVRFAMSLGCKPLPMGESFNVVGEVPGSDPSGEIVLLGAHIDSWDVGVGAIDDAAGCAMIIEAARLIASLPERPRRTVRIALFTNEELGGDGGRGYGKAHAAEASKHFAAMEADQGDGKAWALRVPGGMGDSAAARRLHDALSPLGIALDPGQSRGGMDILSLAPLGVPFCDLRQDATRYFDFHHSANDMFENVSREDLTQATIAFTVSAWVLANMPESLRR